MTRHVLGSRLSLQGGSCFSSHTVETTMQRDELIQLFSLMNVFQFNLAFLVSDLKLKRAIQRGVLQQLF